MAVTVAVVKETAPNERRVAISPEVVKKLAKLGAKVVIQTGAGDPTHQPDSLFGDVSKADDARGALGQADVVFKVAPPTLDEIAAMKEGATKIRNLIANPLTGMVNVPGSYQAQAGCSADWLPECDATKMTQGEDGKWHSGPLDRKSVV